MAKYNDIATEIVKEASYITIATCNKNNEPWIAPTTFWIDEKQNFYFVSHKESKHVQHIMENPNLAISIYNSSVREGTGKGVQFKGTGKLINENNEYMEAMKSMQSRMPLEQTKARCER